MAVLLQHRHAKAVEGVDIAGVVIPCQPMDTLAHFGGGFVGEGDAQNVTGQHTQLVDQISKPVRQRAGFARPRARDHPHHPFGGGHSGALGIVQPLQQIHAVTSLQIQTNVLFALYSLLPPVSSAGWDNKAARSESAFFRSWRFFDTLFADVR